MNKKIIVISGPTASGKSQLAIELATKLNGVILNADSMQIYKGLPILSAQPSEYDKNIVEHRLYRILEPNESNTVFGWLELIKENTEKILKNNKIPIIVGGTGMYISRLINGIKELPDSNEDIRNELNQLYKNIGWNKFYEIVEKIDKESILKLKPNDKHRLIKIYEIYKSCGQKLSDLEKLPNKTLFNTEDIFHINIFPNREELYTRCNLRFKLMLEKYNVIDEIKEFIKNNEYIFNKNKNYPITHTIGLLEIKEYLYNEITYEEMYLKSTKNTRNYAKRQYTWFRNQFKTLDFLFEEIPNINNIKNLIGKIV